MYGTGIGRYGSGQLPDVTISANGALAPITALHSFAGFVWHPREGLDIYGYGGIEQADGKFFDNLGFGNPAFDNAGCTITTASSFSTGTTPTCIANDRRLTAHGTHSGVLAGSVQGPSRPREPRRPIRIPQARGFRGRWWLTVDGRQCLLYFAAILSL